MNIQILHRAPLKICYTESVTAKKIIPVDVKLQLFCSKSWSYLLLNLIFSNMYRLCAISEHMRATTNDYLLLSIVLCFFFQLIVELLSSRHNDVVKCLEETKRVLTFFFLKKKLLESINRLSKLISWLIYVLISSHIVWQLCIFCPVCADEKLFCLRYTFYSCLITTF